MTISYQSDLLNKIKPAAALAVAAKATELKAAGAPVINLSLGEPDFDTPPHVLDAAERAMRGGATRYTVPDGSAELKDAVVEKFKRDNTLTYTRENISCANGAKQSIYNTLLATLNPGDEVLFGAPHWVSYTGVSTLAGGIPRAVPCSAASNYKLTPQALEDAITPATRWVIFNSPANPTGAVYSRGEYKALGEVLARHPRVLIMSDEIYEHIYYLDTPFASFGEACPALFDRTVIINGVAKAYAMTGWRIGYLAAPAELAKVASKIQSQTTANPCSISQAAAIEALTGPQEFIVSALSEYCARRDLISDGLERLMGMPVKAPDGAFYVFPDMTAYLGRPLKNGLSANTDVALATMLLETANVACVPGSAFGSPGHIRFSFATSRKNIGRAMDNLETLLPGDTSA
ncbi:pyridoxal phosphate-dependent aminotransferase [Halomonas sp. 86]|uniref:pyridoxal phosphate-dependent aminotransferase n=1 Tax=unclassified Halomonas TaxID=2609666 RepID=UPI0040346A79